MGDFVCWTQIIAHLFGNFRRAGLLPIDGSRLTAYGLYSLTVRSVIMFGHNFSQVINIYFATSIADMADVVFITSTNVLAYVKSLLFAKEYAKVKRVLRMLEREDFLVRTEEENHTAAQSVNVFMFFYRSVFLFLAANLGLWLVTPLFLSGRELPFAAWFPFDWRKSPSYQLTYMYQVLGIIYLTMSNYTIDTLFYCVHMMAWNQCTLLARRLSMLDRDFPREILKLIAHHKAICSFTGQMNEIFNWIIFGQFFTSAVGLALAMYRLSGIDEINSDFGACIFYCCGLVQQLIIYYGNSGSTFSDKYEHISTGIYMSNWVSQSAKVKSTLLIFAMNCQKPFVISAMGIFPLNLDTCMRIMKSAWSFYVMLSQFKS